MNKANKNFAVKRTVTGLGLFTLQSIPTGKRIIEYIGPIVSAEVVTGSMKKYFFELDDERSIDGSSRTNLARYINHSCAPNAEAFTTGRRIWIWAKKKIEAGEQITIDYGKEYFDTHITRCKCQKCSARPSKNKRA
jgi:SET domain-containing protein